MHATVMHACIYISMYTCLYVCVSLCVKGSYKCDERACDGRACDERADTHTDLSAELLEVFNRLCKVFIENTIIFVHALAWAKRPIEAVVGLVSPVVHLLFSCICNQLNSKKWKTPMHDIIKSDKDIMRIVTKETDLMRMKTGKGEAT